MHSVLGNEADSLAVTFCVLSFLWKEGTVSWTAWVSIFLHDGVDQTMTSITVITFLVLVLCNMSILWDLKFWVFIGCESQLSKVTETKAKKCNDEKIWGLFCDQDAESILTSYEKIFSRYVLHVVLTEKK